MSSDRVVVHAVPPEPEKRRAIVEYALRRGFRRFAALEDDLLPEASERIRVTEETYRTPAGRTIPRRNVGTPEELQAAVRAAQPEGALAVRWTADRVIPLENTIADQGSRLELWVTTSRVAEVPSLLGALERGADVVVVELQNPGEVDDLEAVLDATAHPPVSWLFAKVVRVVPVGLSDRVLLDTTSLLAEDEGFAVGSRASALFHLRSEAVGSAHSRPRRFRVNAGAPHSYVLMADGSTRYLSELEPGEELLGVRDSGRTRGVRLGRLKIERRPTVLVEAMVGGERASVFLQEAETVRLSGELGGVAVTSLAPGVSVQVASFPPARHLGRTVDETIEER
ncbi:MAG: 3-dehydroquinate synthase II [Thermoplasmata archaeon]|nr:3-dehydroquinate synthase II [Thermoplasmata archaeon]